MAEKMKFEAALARLEEIVEALENGNAELDRSLALFEEGVKLVRFCTEKLDHAEQKVSEIRLHGDGFAAEPFGETEA